MVRYAEQGQNIIFTGHVLNIPAHYFQSVGRLADPYTTIESRLRYQKFGVSIIAENPIFGSFPGRYRELADAEEMGIGGSVHSLYLATALDFGVPMALIIILVLIYSFFLGSKLLRQCKKELSINKNSYLKLFLIASTAYSISIIIHGFSEGYFYYLIFLNFGYIIAAKNILIKRSKTINSNNI